MSAKTEARWCVKLDRTAAKARDMPEARPENGHLRLPNEVVEKLATLPLNGTQWRILWAVWRRTLCWQKSSWRNEPFPISLSDLAEATRLPRQLVAREVRRLIGFNLLERRSEPGKKGLVCFNLDTNTWVVSDRPNPVEEVYTNQSPGCIPSGDHTVYQSVTGSYTNRYTAPDTKSYLGNKPKETPKKLERNKGVVEAPASTTRDRPAKPSLPDKKTPGVKEVLDAVSRKAGYQIPSYAKEGAAVKRALRMGFGPDQFIACWEVMKTFAFWQGKWLPLAKVTENLGEFVAGRLRDSGRRPDVGQPAERQGLREPGPDPWQGVTVIRSRPGVGEGDTR